MNIHGFIYMRVITAAVFVTLSFFKAGAVDAEIDIIKQDVRQNAEKFPILALEYDASGKAVIRFINPATDCFLNRGFRYFGFR
ncbi:MAG: hypothetical protein ABIP97_04250, partial [Chthoniobacterales bacterium]